MKVKSDRKQVADYIELVRDIVTDRSASYRTYHIEPRRKNKECVLELGFNYKSVIEEIAKLTVRDYCDGPVEDKDIRGYVWIFGKAINTREIYIKIKTVVIGDLRQVRVISFHEADRELRHPYK